jgi:uncharacterized protein with GYD domain
MPTYVMLTRLNPEAVSKPSYVEDLEKRVTSHIRKHCPEVKWIGSYSILGPYDYLDLFEAPSEESATKLALITRSFGHGTTETWIATPCDRYVKIAKEAA